MNLRIAGALGGPVAVRDAGAVTLNRLVLKSVHRDENNHNGNIIGGFVLSGMGRLTSADCVSLIIFDLVNKKPAGDAGLKEWD